MRRQGDFINMVEIDDLLAEVEAFAPSSRREELEKDIIVNFIRNNKKDVLLRSNAIAHMTSSSMIFDASMTKVLMAYHNIYKSWAWSGGHADGDCDLMAVAIREAVEETGIDTLTPITESIISLDILTVPAHEKHGAPVNAHLHLSVCYGFTADTSAPLRIKPDENSRVGWLPIDALESYVSEPDKHMLPIYYKIIDRARKIHSGKGVNVW